MFVFLYSQLYCLSLKSVLSGFQQTTVLHHLFMWSGERRTVTAFSCVDLLVAVCCITVPSITAHNTSHRSVYGNDECIHICAMCRAWLSSKETRHPVLSLAGFTSAALYWGEKGKSRYELDFDRGLGTQNNIRLYFCTLLLNTKNTASSVKSKCRASSCRAS